MKRFADKVVFITGGAKGIGRGLVAHFSELGAVVCFCDIDVENGRNTARDYDAHFYLVDVTNAEQIQSAMDSIFAKYGDIDIIINNAGVSIFTPLTEISVSEYDAVLSTNLRPVFITSRYLSLHRNTPEGKKRYGRIVNIASTRYLQSEPASEAYASSKGGVVSLTHALAVSFSDYNITVNCISPGWIETGNSVWTENDKEQHPSKRLGSSNDIARACEYLCAEDNDFINGQNLVIDGGMTKKMIYLE